MFEMGSVAIIATYLKIFYLRNPWNLWLFLDAFKGPAALFAPMAADRKIVAAVNGAVIGAAIGIRATDLDVIDDRNAVFVSGWKPPPSHRLIRQP
jgi:hypothetical protein